MGSIGLPSDPPIYAGFSASAGGFLTRIFGDLIRGFSGGDVNHAFIVYWDPAFQDWRTVGANVNGVSYLTLTQFEKSRVIRHLLAPVGFNLWDGMREHEHDIGKHYDFTGLFGMAFVEIARKLHEHPQANLLHTRGDLFCSMWVAEIIRSSIETVSPPITQWTIRNRWPLYNDNPDVIDPAELCQAGIHSHVFAEEDLTILDHQWRQAA